MIVNAKDERQNVRKDNNGMTAASTLLPMLVAGLVLIVIGMITVVSFV